MVLTVIPRENKMDVDNIGVELRDEAFVDISEYSHGRILTDMKYLEAGRPGAIPVAYVRESVAKMLLRASQILPDGYRLKIYDAWRPYSVQKSIYDEYFHDISRKEENAGLTDSELHALTKKFVSFPSTDKTVSYVHSSGGAVDLTLCYKNGNEVDMGCGVDEFTVRAASDAYEDVEGEIRDNRRLLYTVMTETGFTNYCEEWWHFDYGDIFWAAKTGNKVIYRSVFTEEEVKDE